MVTQIRFIKDRYVSVCRRLYGESPGMTPLCTIVLLLYLTQVGHTVTHEIGNLPTEFSVDQGAARLRIPLPTPPGLSDLLPSLGLAYSSGGRTSDSIVGHFWRLDGLPAISRCPMTVAQDGKQRGIEFDSQDAFCLDGARLVAVGVNVFRTEIDSYRKINGHGSEGVGPKYFTLRTKDNRILTFGGSSTSRHKSQGERSIYAWYLSSVEDYVGNKVDFHYKIDGQLPLITNVTMKGRQITFTYANRLDQRTVYHKGRLLSQMKKQLTNVMTYMDGTLDKDLRIHYKVMRVSKLSVVEKVELCSRGKCLRPYTIKYDGKEDITKFRKHTYWIKQFGQKAGGWRVESHPRFVVDVNGDGLADVVGFANAGVYVSLNSDGGTFLPNKLWLGDFGYSAGGWRVQSHPRFVTDVNGDGLPDIVGMASNGVYVALNTGRGSFAGKTRWSTEFGTNTGWRIKNHLRFLKDMNGDGRPDVVGFSNGGVNVALNTGSGFSVAKLWINQFGYVAGGWRVESHPRQLADVNGDGLPDVVGFANGGVYVAINTGTGLTSYRQWYKGFGSKAGGWSVSLHPRYVVDVNGDNLADIVGFSCCGVSVALSNGKSFLPSTVWTKEYGQSTEGWAVASHPRELVDVNGDGLVDIVGFSCCSIVVALNTGTSFTKKKVWTTEYGTNTGWAVNKHPRFITDVTGDGLPDIVGFANAGVVVAKNRNIPLKLKETVDSYGNKRTVQYASTATKSVYKRNSSTQYPNANPSHAQMIVQKVGVSNGIGGYNETTLTYEGALMNLQGRGYLGFRKVIETQLKNNLILEKHFHQEFPYTSLLKTSIRKMNKIVVDSMNWKYTRRFAPHKVTQIILYEMNQLFYEVNGKLVKKEDTKFKDVDEFGNVKLTEKLTIGGNKRFNETTQKVYIVDKENWFIDQLTAIKVIHNNGEDTKVRQSSFEYDKKSRLIRCMTKEPHRLLGLKVSYIYDGFGNVIEKTEQPLFKSDPSMEIRIVKTKYDSDGFQMLSMTNSLGHEERYTYDNFGNVIKMTGSNGLQTNWQYDAFDRKVLERHADGTKIRWLYQWDNKIKHSVYKILKLQDAKSSDEKMYDAYDRVLRISTKDFRKREICEDFVYDGFGRIEKQSIPHERASTLPKWIVYTYDSFGRELSVTKPHNTYVTRTVNTTYEVRRVIKSDKKGVIKDSKQDASGKIVEVIDADGKSMKYKYDALGYLIETRDSLGNVVATKYDALGNKIEMRDPDMGTWRYGHNAYGDLLLQSDGKSQEMFQKYDSLGRIVERREKEGVTKWTYDSGPYGIGKLINITSEGFARAYTYDKFGRERSVSTLVGHETFTIFTFYDNSSRIEKQIYPGGKQIFYCHDDYSYLTAVRRAPCNVTSYSHDYWRALDYNQDGELVKERTGNGLITEYKYDEGRHLTEIQTSDTLQRSLRHWQYKYDVRGNVVQRNDRVGPETTSEVFKYDKLDRLVESTLTMTVNAKKKAYTEDWKYNSIGNIVRYSGLGGIHYEYDPNKPHAVISAGPNKYQYDENGNLVMKNEQKLQWTSFNKLDSFELASVGEIRFKYDQNRMKFWKSSNKENVTYIGKVFERVTHLEKNGNKSKTTHYDKYFIHALGKLVAIEYEELIYLHTDHLGSVDTITDSNGQIMEILRYNAFGRRRSQKWYNFEICPSFSQKPPLSTKRGFTGHEHLEDIDLIDMDGRVYDALVGRFLSPDPFIQDPYNPQNFNRYSYVLNNPMKLKDPSGYFFKALKRAFKKYWKPIVAVAASVVTLGAATPFVAGAVAAAGITGTAAAVTTGFIAGAASGFVGGTVITGNIKGGLKGALGGAVTGGIGGYYGSAWNLERVASNAVAGGTISELTGGKFKDGLIIAGATAGARYLYNTAVKYDVTWKPGGGAVAKCDLCPPAEGANNIGTQGHMTINPEGWFNEGGIVSRLANKIPGVNAVSGMHDVFQIKLDRVPLPGARDIFNVPGMPVAAAVTYSGLLDGTPSAVLVVDKTKRR